MPADQTGGFYSFEQLLERGDVRNRTDLWRKQQLFGFPRSVKLSKKQAGFPKRAVHAWERSRIEASMQAAEMQAAE